MTSWWSAAAYRSWPANDLAVPTRHKGSAARLAGLAYLRTATVAVVGGIWAGALFTGPAVRLIMRLLAATAGNDAQGKLTEADEVVGAIDLEGTFGLFVFGGLLPRLLSGLLYVQRPVEHRLGVTPQRRGLPQT